MPRRSATATAADAATPVSDASRVRSRSAGPARRSRKKNAAPAASAAYESTLVRIAELSDSPSTLTARRPSPRTRAHSVRACTMASAVASDQTTSRARSVRSAREGSGALSKS